MLGNTFTELTHQRAFMRMWFARLFGTTGNQMLMVAVGWQMYELTGSAWDLGLVGLYQFLPALLLTLVAGHVADRLHRGRIVAACLVTQASVALILVAATQGWGASSGWASRELLLGVSVMLGVARAFQMPAQQALTPMLVPPLMLPRAMAFSSAGMQAAVITGPALGGVIFVAGATAVYASCAFLFVIGCGLIAVLHYDHVPPPREPVSMRTLLAGAEFVWRRKALLGAVSLDLFAVLLGGATALLPMFAKDILHVGPWGLGLLRAAPAAGALLTSVVLTRWPLERRVGRWSGGWAAPCCWRWRFTACACWCLACRRALCCRWGRWRFPAALTWSAWWCARRWCKSKRPTTCGAGSARSTRYLSARPTSWANLNRARRRPCWGRSGRWWRAVSARCWWLWSGSGNFRRWRTATA